MRPDAEEEDQAMIVYDCEIVKAIPPRKGVRLDGIDYCDGWDDVENMGISVICAYDYDTDRYRVFCADNFAEFQALVDGADVIVGFNSLKFDNQLCRAHGLEVFDERSFDLLVEIWRAHGLGPKFQYPSHAGYGLEAVAQANFGVGKTNNGAFAPVLWQQGKIGAVIDYCLEDVRLTKRLMDLILSEGYIKSPKADEAVQIPFDRPKAA